MRTPPALLVAAVVGMIVGSLVGYALGVGVVEGQCLISGTGVLATCDKARPSLTTFAVGGGLGAVVVLCVVGFLLLARTSATRVSTRR